MFVAQNLEIIQKNIDKSCKKAGRDPKNIHIIAVTKYVSIERAQEAVDAGITHLGENYTDGFKAKYEALGEDVTWHFIGTLQTRKVKDIIDDVDYIHSLDRISLAKEINKRATKKIKCFVQVNVSEEETKHGLSIEEVEAFLTEIDALEHVQVVGFMTMAPYVDDEAKIRTVFQTLQELRDDVQGKFPHLSLTELSMGMSNDYQIAVEEGATFVRIGSSLVGNER
ncbi:YggS family pyridoxal phosphate-dependent enzyme [Massilibacterium senegalense]|uniref:YggS family pyridoxal phosphate-dependent enzyme n=1 Tax=Massilibacterium senegalense TaxID=1632858 RepID=UPI0007861EB0|nr:YggS family pyridoxal phosphate-dependent enzyme [Massilibacterium senegalense]